MEKAYIILAHKNEVQLNRLIERLDDDHSLFFIHVDINSTLNKRLKFLNKTNKIHLVPAIETRWAGFGLVEATLNLMKEVRKNGGHCERIILLSGQDYPIKSNDYINDFFKSSYHSIFMDYLLLPNYKKWNDDGGSYRFNKYFFGFNIFYSLAAKTMNFLATSFTALQRKLATTMRHYYGSQWWILDTYGMYYILEFVEKNPNYSSFHQFTFAPDELFFQSILLNSEDEKIKNSILNDGKRFIKWSDKTSPHPETLRKNDLDSIIASSSLFARKFDTEVDSEILDLIDKSLLLNNGLING